MARAEAGDAELVVKGAGRGWLYAGGGRFRSDRRREPLIPDVFLRARALFPGGELTYTMVPPGSGRRIALDRDEDGRLDGDDPGLPSR